MSKLDPDEKTPDEPGDWTHRTEIDVTLRDPTAERLADIGARHIDTRLEIENRHAMERRQADRIRVQQILDQPRISRPGWGIVLVAEAIFVLGALAALFNSGIGFTRTSVLVACAVVLVPVFLTSIVYTAFDADIKKSARRSRDY